MRPFQQRLTVGRPNIEKPGRALAMKLGVDHSVRQHRPGHLRVRTVVVVADATIHTPRNACKVKGAPAWASRRRASTDTYMLKRSRWEPEVVFRMVVCDAKVFNPARLPWIYRGQRVES